MCDSTAGLLLLLCLCHLAVHHSHSASNTNSGTSQSAQTDEGQGHVSVLRHVIKIDWPARRRYHWSNKQPIRRGQARLAIWEVSYHNSDSYSEHHSSIYRQTRLLVMEESLQVMSTLKMGSALTKAAESSKMGGVCRAQAGWP